MSEERQEGITKLERGLLVVTIDTARVFLIDAGREVPEIAGHMAMALGELRLAVQEMKLDECAESVDTLPRELVGTLSDGQRRLLAALTLETARSYLAEVAQQAPSITAHVAAAIIELNRAATKLGTTRVLVCVPCRISRAGEAAAVAAASARAEADKLVGYHGGHVGQRFACPLCENTWQMIDQPVAELWGERRACPCCSGPSCYANSRGGKS